MPKKAVPLRFIFSVLFICSLLIPLISTSAKVGTQELELTSIPGYPCYRTIEEVQATGATLTLAYPNLAEWIDIGDSWDKTNEGDERLGYDVWVLKLTNQSITSGKPKILIVSGQHAGELAPVELNLRFGEYLLSSYGTDPDITWILDHQEVHLLLIANPDGRSLVEAGTYWHKNTNATYCPSDPSQRGADLNRNFAFQWQDSFNPCEDDYSGASANSEPETSAIQAYILAEFVDQNGEDDGGLAPLDATGIVIDLHSYPGNILWPFAYTDVPAPNDAQLAIIGNKLGFFNNYEPMRYFSFYQVPHYGTVTDFVYGTLGIASFMLNLGTILNENCSHFSDSILPKNLPALLYAVKSARMPYLIGSGPEVLNTQVSQEIIRVGQPITLTAEIYGAGYWDEDQFAQDIKAAEFSLDVPVWDINALPTQMQSIDGAFNSVFESVSAEVDTTELGLGTHILYLHGQSENDNWGAVSAIFFDVGYELYLPMVVK